VEQATTTREASAARAREWLLGLIPGHNARS
jgi:hypothetical protein